jgi:hypothetical protein
MQNLIITVKYFFIRELKVKIRKQFVSNSSSTSFTCDICGRTESGFDLCMSDVDFVESKYGTYCAEHLLKSLNEIEEEIGDDFDRYKIPKEYCPLYNLEIITDRNLVAYYIKDRGVDEDSLSKEIKQRFGNLDNFNQWLKNK